MTNTPRYNLAIETSSRCGSVTLGVRLPEGQPPAGQPPECLASVEIPPQLRHRLDLMPTIDRLCQEHDVVPQMLDEIYVSVGPGSFTGLRIGITTAKILARLLGARVVAVPTLDVLAENVPGNIVESYKSKVAIQDFQTPDPRPQTPSSSSLKPQASSLASPSARLVICLNMKRDTVYAGVFQWRENRWMLEKPPTLTTLPDLLTHLPGPVWLVCDPLSKGQQEIPGTIQESHNYSLANNSQTSNLQPQTSSSSRIHFLPAEFAQPRSETLWQVGQRMAQAGQFTAAEALLPLYVRQPEAEELWQQRQAPAADLPPK